MPSSESVPAAIAALDAASTNGSSYAISCAPARMPPSNEYLFALDQQRHGQKDEQAAEQLRGDLERNHDPAPHSPSAGTPGGSIRRRPGDAASCSDSPGSFAPGHDFATRDASTNSLRNGLPSKPS